MLSKVYFLLVLIFLHKVEGGNECVNVKTSEGTVTLQHGEAVCAPLVEGEFEADKGKRFLTCSQGTAYIQACNSVLRFDVVYKTCTWPANATCRLAGDSKEGSTTKEPIASQQSTTFPINTSNSTTTVKTYPSTISTARPETQPPSGPCGPETCKLPNCFCYGDQPNLPLSDRPQFIMLTFDDALTSSLYSSFFKSLLVDNTYNILNPNGCPIRATFYINHDYTDYGLVKKIADKGHEIASHTVNHSQPTGDSSADYPAAEAEIVGMREKVLQGTGDAAISDSMVGFRAPYLRNAHDVQFEVLKKNRFLYDTSITNVETYSGRPPLYPHTLDFIMPRCTNLPCPTKSHPGLWEVPINGFVGSDNYSCSMIDVCAVGSNVFTATEKEYYDFYKKNFESYFYPVKVPMHMFTHGSMFLRSPPSYPALISWYQDLQLTHKDVWIVTPKMVIEWMKNPLSVSQMIAEKWGC